VDKNVPSKVNVTTCFKLFIFLLLLGFIQAESSSAQRKSLIIEPSVNLVDGSVAPYNALTGGDTVFFRGGNHDYLLIRNLSGEPGNPLIFMNYQGTVIIDTDHHFGVSIENCSHFRFTGTGLPDVFYGFRIQRVNAGGGFGVGHESSDFEIDHVYIANVPIGGLYAKTDPDCSFSNTRDKFTQFNTIIHDNYIANVGNEGMYVGNTKFFGQVVQCNGTDTLLLPSLLDGVHIYNNILSFTGWDGIQVSSASSNCNIYDNFIMYDSELEKFGQMSGILIGGGSKCDCFNNFITDGKGNGIESHGLGGYRIFNNLIVNAGKTFKPDDTLQMKYGIYLSDVSVRPDSSFHILFNDILNPKSDGIRYNSILSKNNKIFSNVIINPGNFDYYEHGNFTFKGIDSYVMVPDPSSDVTLKNNYFARNDEHAGFAKTNYSLLPGSPLIDSGSQENLKINFDFYHHNRPYNNFYDIGAFEYDPSYLSDKNIADQESRPPFVSPNPVKSTFRIDFYTNHASSLCTLWILDLHGYTITKQAMTPMATGAQLFKVEMAPFPTGLYLYRLAVGKKVFTGRFIKTD
jgi:hypothetical protein